MQTLTKMQNNEQHNKNTELEIDPKYIKDMQTEGLWAASNGDAPEMPTCPYYMMGYDSVKR